MRTLLSLGTTLAVCASTSAQPRIAGEINVDLAEAGKAANETTAAASEFDPSTIVAGWNDYRDFPGRTGFSLSFNGGYTWQNEFLPNPDSGSVQVDPMTAFDNRTGDLWAGFITVFTGAGGGPIYVARLDYWNRNWTGTFALESRFLVA